MQRKLVGSVSGIALLTVLIFLIIIASLTATALFIMTGTTFLSIHQVERAKAYYVAEAGMIHNLDRLRQGQPPQDITLNIDGKAYTAQVTTYLTTVGSANQYTVTGLNSSVNY